MDKWSRWAFDHPIMATILLIVLDFLLFYALVSFWGCASGPPRRFENGDRTVLGPNRWEVIDPDMAKPEAD